MESKAVSYTHLKAGEKKTVSRKTVKKDIAV